MKKTVLCLLCLALFCALFVSCGIGRCHHLNMTSETTLPTCDKEGYVTHVCPDCGYTYQSDFKAPLGHSFTYVITPPACANVGYTTFTCSVCAYSYVTDYAVPTGHNFTVKTVPPTCTEAGYDEYTCSVCTYSYRQDFKSAPGHDFEGTVTEPTCTAAGYTDYTCKNCKFSYRSDFVNATGHDFKTERKAPTLTDAGLLTHTCATCAKTYESDPVQYGELLISSEPEDEPKRARGVDLSHHNGNVDFKALKAGGFDFVILRAGFSDSGKDSRFEEYYAGATAAGLDIGCYLYTESKTEANIKTDVKKLLGYLNGKKLTYPVYLDIETDQQQALSADVLSGMLRAFATGMLDAGYFPGLYTNPKFLTTAFASVKPELIMDIWLARHNTALYNSTPDYYLGQYGVWQYSDSGNAEGFETIPGVNGSVDIDVAYRDYPALIKKYGWSGN